MPGIQKQSEQYGFLRDASFMKAATEDSSDNYDEYLGNTPTGPSVQYPGSSDYCEYNNCPYNGEHADDAPCGTWHIGEDAMGGPAIFSGHADCFDKARREEPEVYEPEPGTGQEMSPEEVLAAQGYYN